MQIVFVNNKKQADHTFTSILLGFLLGKVWHTQKSYLDYATSRPPDVTKELKRVDNADFDLACALLMMILREDHFCDSFEERHKNGDVKKVVDRIAETI